MSTRGRWRRAGPRLLVGSVLLKSAAALGVAQSTEVTRLDPYHTMDKAAVALDMPTFPVDEMPMGDVNAQFADLQRTPPPTLEASPPPQRDTIVFSVAFLHTPAPNAPALPSPTAIRVPCEGSEGRELAVETLQLQSWAADTAQVPTSAVDVARVECHAGLAFLGGWNFTAPEPLPGLSSGFNMSKFDVTMPQDLLGDEGSTIRVPASLEGLSPSPLFGSGYNKYASALSSCGTTLVSPVKVWFIIRPQARAVPDVVENLKAAQGPDAAAKLSAYATFDAGAFLACGGAMLLLEDSAWFWDPPADSAAATIRVSSALDPRPDPAAFHPVEEVSSLSSGCVAAAGPCCQPCCASSSSPIVVPADWTCASFLSTSRIVRPIPVGAAASAGSSAASAGTGSAAVSNEVTSDKSGAPLDPTSADHKAQRARGTKLRGRVMGA